MTIEESLGIEEFDPSAVTADAAPVSALDEEQLRIVAAFCEREVEKWKRVRALITESWKAQEHLRDLLKKELGEDIASYAVQGLVGGSAAQFAAAYDLASRRMADLEDLRKRASERRCIQKPLTETISLFSI